MSDVFPRLDLSALYGPAGGGIAKSPPVRPVPRRLGVCVVNGEPFTLQHKQREDHLHIVGGTKRGKSVLMEMLIRQDLENPDCALCLIDPHRGSTYDNLLRYIATERPALAKRLVLFKPSAQTGAVMGFNPLGKYARDNPHYALNMMISACLKAWGQDKTDRTPRITRWLENIFYLIIANSLTLLEAAPLISSRKHNPYRDALLRQVQNFFIEEDWNDFAEAPNTLRNQYLEGAHNRMRKFLRNPYLQQVFGQQSHVLDMEEILASNRILLVSLPEGVEIDRESNQLIGVLLIHEIFRAILGRDPQSNPPPFYLYIDEFAQFVTREVAYLLEEARKYGLYLTLAHQHLAQLREQDEYLYASVLTNCHNRAVFGGLSSDDAMIMDREINTGFRDLYAIKETVFNTKFRPVQEWQQSVSVGAGASQSVSEAFGAAFGRSLSLGEALARGMSRSVTETDGVSEQTGVTDGTADSISRQRQRSRNTQRGKSIGANLSAGESRGVGEQRSETETTSQSVTHQHGHTQGTTVQHSEQTGTGLTTPPFAVSSQVTRNTHFNHGTASGVQESTQTSEAQNSGQSRSTATAASEQRGANINHGLTESENRNEGEGAAESLGASKSVSRSVSRTLGKQHTRAVGRTDTLTATRNVSRGLNAQTNASHTEQSGRSQNLSIGWRPGVRHEEFQEKTHVFWTLEEQREQAIGSLMRQPIGVSTFQIGQNPPVRVKVDYRPALPHNAVYTPPRLAFLERRVVAAHAAFYLPAAEALAEIRRRQEAVFGEALRIDFSGEILLPADPSDNGANPHSASGSPAALPGPGPHDADPGLFTDDDD
jgi:hypothetical protein